MKTNLKLPLVVLVFLGLFGISNAQESAFEMLLPYEMDNIQLTYCCETSDGNFLVIPGSFCKMLKMSPTGEIIKEATYRMVDEGGSVPDLTWIGGMLDIPGDPSHHILIAEAYDDDTESHNRIHIFKIDDDLQYNDEEVIKVDFSEYIKHIWSDTWPPRYVLDEDGCISFATHVIRWDGTYCLMYARVSPDGAKTVAFDGRYGFDSYEVHVCDFKRRNDRYDMLVGFRTRPGQTPHFTGACMYEVSDDFESDSVCTLVTAKSSESLLVYNNLSDSLCWAVWELISNITPVWMNDSVFLMPTVVHGCSVSGVNSSYGVGVWKLDAGYNLLDYILIDVFDHNNGMNQETLWPVYPLLVNGDDVYLCYYVCKGSMSGPIRTVVCKLDTELNLKWKRWYGVENGQYMVTGTALTSDGGCLLTGGGGENTSTFAPGKHPSPYILKITSDGYCSVMEDNEPLLKPFNCYPNPVDDILQMEYSPDVTPKAVELYDLQGRLIKTQDSSLESIGMENLPAGNYILRVLLDDGKTYTEKVVKAH